ncbi:MAG: FAD-binding oxidoreductase [Chloroflexi bacterium]|nr:FAD-binding oxidoreductase [Chloroflexota bacterium]
MIPDVVVIGGGIVGCSCAYYLAKAGVKVHLLERGSIGSGASKAGMCHLVTWHEPEIHLQLGREAVKLYEELSHEVAIDIEFRKTGSIAFFENKESLDSNKQMVQSLHEWGIKCQFLEADELIKFEPALSSDLAGGVYYAEDAQVNPLYATLAMAIAARQMGAKIETSAEVVDMELNPKNNTIETIITKSGRITPGLVVIAAGAWSGLLGEKIGLKIPISPRKGHLIVTAPMPENLFRVKTILSAGYLESVKAGNNIAVAVNVEQTKNGNLLIGSSRQFVGFDRSVDPKVISLMAERTLHVFPFLKQVNAIRTWTGFRPYTPDLTPIIGEVDAFPNLYLASGHEGLGITEGPVTGKLISQLITGGRMDINIDSLSLNRFSS